MQQINLEELFLNTYDSNNQAHKELIDKFMGMSHSSFISSIDSRLKLNRNQKSFPFDTGFVVSGQDKELIGYLFISSIKSDEVYLEYSLLKEKRGKGYGSLLLNNVTEYLFLNYNLKDIALDIDVSNEASMYTASKCGYYEDEYLANGRIIYRNFNLNYVDKRRRGNMR